MHSGSRIVTDHDQDHDVWWYICQICHRAYAGNTGVRAHRRAVHPNSPIGLKNVLIMSQLVDLGVRVKVERCDKERITNSNSHKRTRTTKGIGIRASRRKTKAQAQVEQVTMEAEVEPQPELPRPKPKPDPSPRPRIVKEEILSPPGDDDTATLETDSGPGWFHVHGQQKAEALFEEEQDFGYDQQGDDPDPDWMEDGNSNSNGCAGRSRLKRKAKPKKSKSNPIVNRNGKDKDSRISKPISGGDSPDPDWKCPVCSKPHITRRDLKRHQRDMHGDDGDPRNHICPTCGRPLKSQVCLQAHIRTHDPANNKPFICDVCAKAFYTNSLLLRHRTMHEPPTLKCPEEGCGKMFAHNAALQKHKKIKHSGDERRYKCDKDGCGASFKILLFLRRHVAAVHAEIRSFACPQCSRGFKSRQQLLGHLSRYRLAQKSCTTTEGKTQTNNDACQICELQFPSRKSLQNHELSVHSIQPVFACLQCDKKFTSARSVRIHEAGHSDERPQMCETCGKSFKLKSALRRHLASHLPVEERRHVCNTGRGACRQRFATLGSLRRHQRTLLHGDGAISQSRQAQETSSKSDCSDTISKEDTIETTTTTPIQAMPAIIKNDLEIDTALKNHDRDRILNMNLYG